MKGLFIDFEGIDGSGKGSLIRLLIERLKNWGVAGIVMGKEPGGTPLGLKIRDLLFEDPTTHQMADSVCDCLFLADHIQHVEKVIKPALAAGQVIISDRYAYSQFAYGQERTTHPLIYQAYEALIGPVPDVIFLLGGTPEHLLERAQGRTAETHQTGKTWNNVDAQRKIQDFYQRMLIPMPQTVWVDTDVLTPEVLFERYLWPPVEKLLMPCMKALTGFKPEDVPVPSRAPQVLQDSMVKTLVPEPEGFVRRKTMMFPPGQVQ